MIAFALGGGAVGLGISPQGHELLPLSAQGAAGAFLLLPQLPVLRASGPSKFLFLLWLVKEILKSSLSKRAETSSVLRRVLSFILSVFPSAARGFQPSPLRAELCCHPSEHVCKLLPVSYEALRWMGTTPPDLPSDEATQAPPGCSGF